MKAKIMALMMAAGLGMTGIAMTAQAADAGARAASGCAHTGEVVVFTEVETAVNCGNQHYVEYKYTYYCSDCKSEIGVDGKGTYEPHDYEQIYFDNGSIMSYCTVCDDRYFW